MWHDNNDEKKEYILEQRRRMEDQQLQTIGPIEEEVRIVEYRDLLIGKDKQEAEKTSSKMTLAFGGLVQVHQEEHCNYGLDCQGRYC